MTNILQTRREIEQLGLPECSQWIRDALDADNNTQRLLSVIYGTPGVGKTALSTTLPWCLIGACDRHGHFSLRDMPKLTQIYPDHRLRFRWIRIRNFQDIWKMHKFLKEARHPFKSWCIDGMNELQRMDMDEILGASNHDVPEQRDYQFSTEHFRKLFSDFFSLPMHGMMTVIERTDQDQPTGRMIWKPALTGQLADTIGVNVDIVGRMVMAQRDNQAVRMVGTQPNNNYVAKDLTGKLAGGEVPNFQVWLDKVFGAEQWREELNWDTDNGIQGVQLGDNGPEPDADTEENTAVG